MPMTAKPVPFSQRLRELRAARGMTQAQLQEQSGLSLSLLTKLEQGDTSDPKGSTLAILARALDVTMAELVDGVAFAPTPRRKRKDG